ncbi:LPP20 family lipoprotein [Plebeiibacterium sediminum]|uniref:LPP20 family lipoprotein n=1 Tax=Plebeiibacterium sediminum TaxID=2992112 RepID=A0AAE3M2R7_9BACT|nr:LPP20 family lipoprotein [Plebeiobacterium sediminum]MCW3785901.1 LPP20 family lipoprotein [Plebeiobacterium sediminum]
MKYSLIIVVCLFFVACSSTKKQAELLEQSKPSWVKVRPIDKDYYYGIGIVPKVGSPMLYEDKAKERALADISGQINSTVKSEAVLYQVEDKNGVRDYLQNRIRSVSEGYLEGYEYVDKWEDLSNTYVYYKLSKQKYRALKAKRKAEALEVGKEKYLAAKELKQEGQIVPSIEHFATCIDVLSGYMNELTVVEINGKQVDLVSESSIEITQIIEKVNIVSLANNSISTGDKKNGFLVSYEGVNPVVNMPVKLEYTGGYLVNDRLKSSDEGVVMMPELGGDNNSSTNKLSVKIDLVYLGRQVTRNLYVRKIIENQKAAEISIDV